MELVKPKPCPQGNADKIFIILAVVTGMILSGCASHSKMNTYDEQLKNQIAESQAKAEVDAAGSKEIVLGNLSLSKLGLELLRTWKNAVARSDPYDSSIVAGFNENTLEPALQKFVQGFTTDQGKAWAPAQANTLRQLFYNEEADRATQVARFKDHPEQLKDPHRCDYDNFGKDATDPWRAMIECENVSGITAERDRLKEAANKLRCNDAESCQIIAERQAAYDAVAVSPRELNEVAEKDMAKRDQPWGAEDRDRELQNLRNELQFEDQRRITEETYRAVDRDRKLESLRDEFQAEDQQRRIDAEEKAIDEDEEDHRRMLRAIEHDQPNQ